MILFKKQMGDKGCRIVITINNQNYVVIDWCNNFKRAKKELKKIVPDTYKEAKQIYPNLYYTPFFWDNSLTEENWLILCNQKLIEMKKEV